MKTLPVSKRFFGGLFAACLIALGAYFLGNTSFKEYYPSEIQYLFENILPATVAPPEHAPDEDSSEAALSSEQNGDQNTSGTTGAETESEQTSTSSSGEKEDIEVSGEDEPVFYEKNPRYQVKTLPEGQALLTSEILKGDTAGKILGAWLAPNQLSETLSVAKRLYPLTQIRIGQPIALCIREQDDTLVSFRYDINKDKYLLIDFTTEQPKASIEKIDYSFQLESIKGTIESNLIVAMEKSGGNVSLAIQLAHVFASDINFITDLRDGDTFELLVEKKFQQESFTGYGRILGARFTNQGKIHTAYLFRNEQGRETYYNRNGENLHRELLKAPLSFLRVTSKYTMHRKHPVYGNVRPHQGIDYGAPRGTPIMAVGSGVVTLAGWAGGYGKQVIIRHSNGLESLYGHMSRFAKGMTPGKRVQQGQTIGYVGATGTATGPHLDFRIKRGGNFVNPGKLIVPRDRPLEKKRKTAFLATVNRIERSWKGDAFTDYDPDTWFGGMN